MFIAVVFTVAKIWKQLKCLLMNVGMKKAHTRTHTHSGMSFSHKKKETLTSVTTR